MVSVETDMTVLTTVTVTPPGPDSVATALGDGEGPFEVVAGVVCEA